MPAPADHSTHDRLLELVALARPLAERFAQAGHSLFAVGGAVRDALIGVAPRDEREIDFTTDARPQEITLLLAPLCSTLWEQGREFGTIGGIVRASGLKVEVTTFRSESYVAHSRKPAVQWGDSLSEDLSRRDFTINAIALDVIALAEERSDTRALIDEHGGIADLFAHRLRTPAEPGGLFRDDPLRMLRAARFAARFALEIDPSIEEAARAEAPALAKVSVERVRGELDLLLATPRPSIGLDFLVRTGVADQFLPELPALQLEQDPLHQHKDVLRHTMAVVDKASPDLTVRLAALLHDIGKPRTRAISDEGVTFRFHEVVGAKMARARLVALKYPQAIIDDVSALVELHLRFHTYKLGWTDRAVRRYVRDAGPLLEQLNELTRCDATTRNARKVATFARRMDELERRIVELEAQEDLRRLRPALDGNQVMAELGLPPGPVIGRALAHLMEIRLDEGEITAEDARARLLAWWSEQAESAG